MKPETFDFSDYIRDKDDDDMKSVVLRSMRNRLHWRRDDPKRIKGGFTRTIAPCTNDFADRLIAGSGEELSRVVRTGVIVANTIMSQKMYFRGWKASRVVLNYMPPTSTLVEHVDPEPFERGVLAIGFGAADFFYEGADEPIRTQERSLMFIPAGLRHSVENGDQERVVMAFMDDNRLRDGQTLAGQFMADTVHKLIERVRT